ncbi:MAG: DUF393 domain-containing protein [Candidatus Eremiobacteraeota bacterium]|nr:DUF393 domain-containing protein [Candidatus Eremiobacteraeota bacterium]
MIQIYYDGRCAFCVKAINYVHKLDQAGALAFHDANDTQNMRRVYEATGLLPDFSRSMWALSDRTLYKGYDAFMVSFKAVPRLRRLGVLMDVPPVKIVGRVAYRIIARNRSRLGCSIATKVPGREKLPC